MRLLNPMFLWTLLSLGPLVLIYLLKVRPRRKTTTAFFLWETILDQKRSTSLLRRLRDVWSLFLMALAFSAVALALAHPQWTTAKRADLLILIDHSASMNARDGRTTRLERAKKIASEIATALSGDQRAAIAAIGDRIGFQTHLTDNPRAVLDAIEHIAPTDQPFKPALLSTFTAKGLWNRNYRIVLISDGCCGGAKVPDRVELLKVGTDQPNIGIIAADIRYLPGAERRVGVYVQLASSYKKKQTVDLLISQLQTPGKQTVSPAAEELRKLVPLSVEPGLNPPQQWTLDGAEPGRWTIKLDLHDALPDDDCAYLALDPPRPIRIAVDSEDRFFFENSVLAFARGNGLLTLANKEPMLVLAKSKTPSEQRSLIFKPQGDSPWWSELGDSVEVVAPRVVVENHPALRYIDVATISFAGARRLKMPAHAQVWVESEQGIPLIYRADDGGRTAVVVNMDPAAAEFYYSAWFPILVHSTALYLAGREQTRLASYRPGTAVPIPGSQQGKPTTVVDPRGDKFTTTKRQLSAVDELGFYQLHNQSGRWFAGCSLLSARETLLNNAPVRATAKPIQRGRPLSAWLLVLAILLLTTESLLYHRRKVG